MRTRFVVAFDVEHEADDVDNVFENVLDAGTMQDALKEYADDMVDGDFEIESAIVTATECLHESLKRKNGKRICRDCGDQVL